MHVRPFFWLLLALSCIAVLIFAATVREHVPVVMQVHIDQHPTSAGFTIVKLHLTDTQGLAIEDAMVFSSANMTNMNMTTKQSGVRYLGQGNYAAQLQLYMAGPWAITIQEHAEGFDSLQQTLLVQVE